jgi:general secretion pathway protein G
MKEPTMQTETTTQAAARVAAPRGMSLLEIMVVITLIGLVTAAIGVAVMGQLGEGQRKSASNQAYEIGKSLELYKLNNGRYPTTSEGLQGLVAPPKGKPLMDQLPKDPWGADYIYTIPGQKNPSKYDIRSRGQDAQEGTEDDVGNWPIE